MEREGVEGEVYDNFIPQDIEIYACMHFFRFFTFLFYFSK